MPRVEIPRPIVKVLSGNSRVEIPRAIVAMQPGTVRVYLGGIKGDSGDSGTSWYVGSGMPPSGTGNLNDCWLDTETGDVYQKTQAGWGTALLNLIGPQAPAVTYQYSVDGVTGWHGTYTGGDLYCRISVDGGTTWSATMKFIGDNGANAPAVQYQYSSDNSSFHETFVSGDKYVRWSADGGNTWTAGFKFIGEDGAGSGDVVGPLSSTNLRIAVFNGITGKALADGGKLIADLMAHSLATATSDFLVGSSGGGTFEKKTLTETRTLLDILRASAASLAGALDCNNYAVYWDLYTVSGTTINVANGNKQKLTLSGSNITVTLTSPAGPTAFHLFIYQDATARTITWPTILWANGTAPDLTTASAKYGICLAWDGTNWFGSWAKYS